MGMPFVLASASEAGIPFDASRTKNRLAKSTPRRTRPIGGMMTPSTRSVTILPNAAPMMTPTARSMALPRAMKLRNSLNTSASSVMPRCLRLHGVQRVMRQDEERAMVGPPKQQLDRALRHIDASDALAAAVVHED